MFGSRHDRPNRAAFLSCRRPVNERHGVSSDFVDRTDGRDECALPLDRAAARLRHHGRGAGLHGPQLRHDCRYRSVDLAAARLAAARDCLRKGLPAAEQPHDGRGRRRHAGTCRRRGTPAGRRFERPAGSVPYRAMAHRRTVLRARRVVIPVARRCPHDDRWAGEGRPASSLSFPRCWAPSRMATPRCRTSSRP